MRELRVSLPELSLIGGTRAIAGAGIGLLLASQLPDSQRKAVGWTLLLIGALTTIPLAMEVLGHSRVTSSPEEPKSTGNELIPDAADRFGRRSAFAES
jgi:uncharacterized membrane protein YfcA